MKLLEALLMSDQDFVKLVSHHFRLMWDGEAQAFAIDNFINPEAFPPEHFVSLSEAIGRVYELDLMERE